MASVSEYRYLQQVLGLSATNMYSLADLRDQYYNWMLSNPPSTITVDQISDASPLIKDVMKQTTGTDIRAKVQANPVITPQVAPSVPSALATPSLLQLSVLVDIVNALNGQRSTINQLIDKMRTMNLLT